MPITKEDLKRAYAQLLTEGRLRLGPPPTAEEVEALFEDRLSEKDADRVRELLAYYPEMARVWVTPFPSEEEAADIFTPEELAEDISKIRRRINRIRLMRKLKPVIWVLAVASATLLVWLVLRLL